MAVTSQDPIAVTAIYPSSNPRSRWKEKQCESFWKVSKPSFPDAGMRLFFRKNLAVHEPIFK